MNVKFYKFAISIVNFTPINSVFFSFEGPSGEKGERGHLGGTGAPGLYGEKGDIGAPGLEGMPGQQGLHLIRFSLMNCLILKLTGCDSHHKQVSVVTKVYLDYEVEMVAMH